MRNLHTIFPKGHTNLHFPPNGTQRFPFSTSSSTVFTRYVVLSKCHLNKKEMIPCCGFAFPWRLVILSIFWCNSWSFVCHIWKNFNLSPWSILKLYYLWFCFCLSHMSFLIYFEYLPDIYLVCKCFLPLHRLHLTLTIIPFSYKEAF